LSLDTQTNAIHKSDLLHATTCAMKKLFSG
jgi:hypothetical protein